ncbi:AIM24 family protein [Streptomyces sp. DSM 44917]|uniref:AIM24 family protein n=1 Tax=Streptomyces boetiae TaxID=3075541 RepID=A0ABU2LAX7_9ACTN|nr:AIM24 family protein [Streptomyces sp. DSM 44917]MDT0308725.1 AIM24 family protein [Streptomyces sp. DSM 44917]
MRSDLFKAEYTAQPPTAAGMSLQHSKAIKYVVNGECHARQGAMVAFRGNLQFEAKSQGVGNFLKRAVTGEGLSLMAVRGQGEVWFAHLAQSCFVIELDPQDALTINGRNVLCFDPTLSYDIKMVSGAGMAGGGLFNCQFAGQGRIGLIADGDPIIIPVTSQAPVYVDTDAVVGWSSNLHTSINRSQSLKSMLRGGSGEAFQLMLQGDGFVIVQPSEAPPPPEK